MIVVVLALGLQGCVSFPDAERVRRCEHDLARTRDERISNGVCITPHVDPTEGKPDTVLTPLHIPYGYFGEPR